MGTTTVEVRPPLPPCLICGELHESKRAIEAAHKGHPDKGRATRAVRGLWGSLGEARAALVLELGPLYSEAAARERLAGVVPPPLLLLEVQGEGSGWDHLLDAIGALEGIGASAP